MRRRDDDEIIRDGQAIRVPFAMMDGVQKDISGAPDYAAVDAAIEGYEQDLRVAWRGGQGKVEDRKPRVSTRDEALAQREHYYQNAWRCPA